MTDNTRRDRDILARFPLPTAQKRVFAGLALLLELGLTACGATPMGSAATGGSGGVTSGGDVGNGGAGGEPAAPKLRLLAVTAGNGIYVAAGVFEGDPGPDTVIVSSADGRGWTLRYRGGDEQVDSVAYGGGHWVAVGWGIKEIAGTFPRTRALLVSDDAITWRAIASPESDGFHQVVWTGSEFLMTGEGSPAWTLWASPDGLAWTERMKGTIPGRLTKGVPGIVGADGAALVFTDDGGATWSSTRVGPANTILGLWPEGNGFAGTAAIICCYGEAPELNQYFSMRSADGRTWDLEPAADPVAFAVAQIGATWVGQSVKSSRLLYRSAETAAWTVSPVGPQSVVAVTAGDRFVAVGAGIWSSDDGKTWTEATLPGELPRY